MSQQTVDKYLGAFIDDAGVEYRVRQICVGDIIGLDTSSTEFSYRLMAMAINVSFDDFKLWPVSVMLRLSTLINAGMEL